MFNYNNLFFKVYFIKVTTYINTFKLILNVENFQHLIKLLEQV